MTRAALVLVAAALGLAVPATAAAPPARAQVSAREFSYTLSRQSLKAGRVILELANYGEDAHDLRLRRVGGRRTYAIGVVQPGAVADLQTALAAGRYQLWCSLADHRARGMHATLVVKP